MWYDAEDTYVGTRDSDPNFGTPVYVTITALQP